MSSSANGSAAAADLTDRVAVVTGGSKGIGRAIVLALAQRGYDVAILDPLEAGREVAAEAIALGRRALYIPLDVASETEVKQAAQDVAAQLGVCRLLVNNAGIFPRASAIDMPFSLWQRVLTVNLGGAFLCSQAFAPGMLAARDGVIVNIASGRGIQGAARDGAHYAASKGGLIALTRSLAQEWAPHIRVNTLVPGVTHTDQPLEATTVDELYTRGKRIPLGRIGQPEDVANGVCLLASADASYITGQSLCVNGGAVML
ncbi:MAG: family NAD(P)-dependent oxidoreductase [Herbaspirillum sp.]|jgi:NAD(P)-dependent dehydrogenase (short-subunit alcohol dehydrogenase family)|nr:family NAD(P)-dependent oxidoreductase [Herbaspirillum sp.]